MYPLSTMDSACWMANFGRFCVVVNLSRRIKCRERYLPPSQWRVFRQLPHTDVRAKTRSSNEKPLLRGSTSRMMQISAAGDENKPWWGLAGPKSGN
jgi:hypothetical protein